MEKTGSVSDKPCICPQKMQLGHGYMYTYCKASAHFPNFHFLPQVGMWDGRDLVGSHLGG